LRAKFRDSQPGEFTEIKVILPRVAAFV
jgi:hypothetical protein